MAAHNLSCLRRAQAYGSGGSVIVLHMRSGALLLLHRDLQFAAPCGVKKAHVERAGRMIGHLQSMIKEACTAEGVQKTGVAFQQHVDQECVETVSENCMQHAHQSQT